VARITG